MGDKDTLAERVDALLINPDTIEKVEVQSSNGTNVFTLNHVPGKTSKSVQIYAAKTDNNSMLTPEGARQGLEVYAGELREDARQNPGKHSSIDFFERVAAGSESFHSHVITRPGVKQIPEHIRKAMPKIAEEFGTPIHIYDEEGIRQTCRDFNQAFSWAPRGYQNFYAVKACPSPNLLELMRHDGFGADCSSAPELDIATAVGMKRKEIMFTSNDTPDSEFRHANQLGAIINLDDLTHIEAFERATGGLPELLCFRYNPGKECEGNSIVGSSEERKYGLTREQIFEAFKIAKAKGVKYFSLHTMMASNERDVKKLIQQADIMFRLARELKSEIGIDLESINLGGGVGTAYHPWDREVDVAALAEGIKARYELVLQAVGLEPKLFTECGRAITGPHGWLLSSVRHVMPKHRKYIGVDATMADLMRPGMYGAYHHIDVLGKEGQERNDIVDVVGSLCENCDKFAVQRFLPLIERGDLLAIHNTGAHGMAMGFNYNGKLRAGGVLVKADGSFELISRPETKQDYFARLNFPGAKYADLAK